MNKGKTREIPTRWKVRWKGEPADGAKRTRASSSTKQVTSTRETVVPGIPGGSDAANQPTGVAYKTAVEASDRSANTQDSLSLSQELRFVAVTDKSLQGLHDPQELRGIRRHVMKDFIRQKSGDGRNEQKFQEPNPSPLSSHVQRFRVGVKKASKTAALSADPESNPRLRALVAKSLLDSNSQATASRLDLAGLLKDSQDDEASLARGISKSTWRTDPFYRLPIDATPDVHKLLDYYWTAFWQNSLAVNPESKWLSVAISDPATFHATLSLVAQHQALLNVQPFMESYFYHRGEAIRIVASRLGQVDEEVSDATIGAVALLTSADENMPWAEGSEPNHMQGLMRMVELRGGLNKLKCNESLKRVVTWADLVHAASRGVRPSLEKSQCNAGMNLLGLFDLPEGLSLPTQKLYTSPPPVPFRLRTLYDTLRVLCVGLEQPKMINLQTGFLNRRVFSNRLYEVEYWLLNPTSTSTSTDRSADLEPSEPIDLLESAGRTAGLLFTHLALRQLPPRCAHFGRLARRLRRTLEQYIPSLDYGLEEVMFSTYYEPEHELRRLINEPALFIWMLMMGALATTPESRSEDHAFYITHLRSLFRMNGITGPDGIASEIKKVLWLELFFRPACQSIWVDCKVDYGFESSPIDE